MERPRMVLSINPYDPRIIAAEILESKGTGCLSEKTSELEKKTLQRVVALAFENAANNRHWELDEVDCYDHRMWSYRRIAEKTSADGGGYATPEDFEAVVFRAVERHTLL